MASDKFSTLLHLVERKAFDPVMRAGPDGRSDADKAKLAEVKRKTGAEIERYRGYGSAEALVTNFKRDLHSDAARKVHADLRSLDLPTIADIRDEVEKKARELGVESGA
ncbi:hypothetical protein PQJ75_26365 [Rhodoplanes sp. TEM]|uniref:Uncharacterized protein n=1 Tax=Rhodoplanes tepidamans TaxID=200616 RepID=A0ABT5J6M9_RHOTP|nr:MULTISPECIES: hypothetical protein [Rhodoplanes]MDC7785308.1 hypothetical protein [Rhodoplanes tepidamans]MDC7987273.1 hypothetical protein [Rhodoplanes sp. TEM]MDQ0353566.1 hypothetical protein [Rhodoplanes tepidamans]